MSFKQKQDKASLRERLSVALDIRPDVFPRSTLVEIRGRESVSVCGGKTLDVYTESVIRIGCADADVVIGGRRLCCRAFRRGYVTITGRIESLRLEEKK